MSNDEKFGDMRTEYGKSLIEKIVFMSYIRCKNIKTNTVILEVDRRL